MAPELTILLTPIILIAILSRLPFLRFPLDDDFAIYTYIARFADKGLQWKKDLFVIGNPIWRMRLLDKLYGNPEQGVMRLRLFFMMTHAITCMIMFYVAWSFTGNLWAAFLCSLLYSFYGSSPDFTAGNYSFEQFYIPFIFFGLALLPKGVEAVPYAGFLFGLAAVAKWSAGSYAAIFAVVVAYRYGFTSMVVFACCAGLPITGAILTDWELGFIDDMAKKQSLTRLATTLRLSRTKRVYFSNLREILKVIGQTLPVWVIGFPATYIIFSGKYLIWLAPFAAMTVAMIVLQRGFSRYHYHPLIALLALTTALGTNSLQYNIFAVIAFSALAAGIAGNLVYMLPFYLRPKDIKNLARHEKFDQYIYLPYLGKVINRLMRIRGETGQRIFVWGTFSQLYHLVGTPASDTFLHHSIGPWDTQDLEPYFDTVISGLLRYKPAYLIKTFHDLDVTKLEPLLGLKYQLLKVALIRFPVYRLVGSQPPAINPLSLPWQEKMRIMQSLTEHPKLDDPAYMKKTNCEWKHIPGINKTDLKEGRLMTTLKECRKLCKLNPYDSQGLYFLGKLYDCANLPNQMIATFRQLLQFVPNHPHVRMIMAKHRINEGNLEEAEKLIYDDISLFGEREESDFYFGKICQKRNQHERAVKHFAKISKTIPDWGDVWLHLAESLIALKRTKEAEEIYKNLFSRTGNEFNDDWLRTQAALGTAQIHAEQRSRANTLEHFSLLDPQNNTLTYAWASALEQDGNPEKACLLFEKLGSTFQKDHLRANAWFRLARLSPLEQREQILNKCLKLSPFHTGALKLLRELEEKTFDSRQ